MKTTIHVACLLALSLVVIVQAIGESTAQCNTVFKKLTKKKFCDATRYENILGVDMVRMLDCVLKAVKVVDQTGMADYRKLYDPMKRIRPDRKHDFNLESCMGRSHNLLPTSKRAHDFYKCMMKSDSKEAFKKVLNEKICQKWFPKL
ncbi:uncharacterized protein LOC131210839 [Anopheles bellator]|uniref:uncharacterized protein LOC131210839 n=1 Tax=Anopheles bellator TaxID=139047 RepID=UPI0026486458|nr:uncharacterized protein LOC131210839 [Anopheles bellator]